MSCSFHTPSPSDTRQAPEQRAQLTESADMHTALSSKPPANTAKHDSQELRRRPSTPECGHGEGTINKGNKRK
eukprot:6312854-Amphidinium_carterae.1